MPVSARTYQVIDLIHHCQLVGLKASLAEILSCIATFRAESEKERYDKAYIAPSACETLLTRMNHDGFIEAQSNNTWLLTPMGDQVASLMEGLDGCSSHFQVSYKESLVEAALLQRGECKGAPANPQQLAALTRLSLDSVRRGLAILVDQGKVRETRKGRSCVYTHKDQDRDVPGLRDPEKAIHTLETLQGIDDSHPNLPGLEEDQAALDELESLIGSLDESPPNLPGLEGLGLQPKLKEAEGPSPSFGEPSLHHLGPGMKALIKGFSPYNEDPVEDSKKEDTTWDSTPEEKEWAGVPNFVQEGFADLASVCNQTLADFLESLLIRHQTDARKALFPD